MAKSLPSSRAESNEIAGDFLSFTANRPTRNSRRYAIRKRTWRECLVCPGGPNRRRNRVDRNDAVEIRRSRMHELTKFPLVQIANLDEQRCSPSTVQCMAQASGDT
jgi:hypothetical protein